jgi:hypothetical protein
MHSLASLYVYCIWLVKMAMVSGSNTSLKVSTLCEVTASSADTSVVFNQPLT